MCPLHSGGAENLMTKEVERAKVLVFFGFVIFITDKACTEVPESPSRVQKQGGSTHRRGRWGLGSTSPTDMHMGSDVTPKGAECWHLTLKGRDNWGRFC